MKKLNLSLFIVLSIVLLVSSCSTQTKRSSTAEAKVTIKDHITSKQERDALSPDDVLKQFIQGNERFKNSNETRRLHTEHIRKVVTDGQFPKAFVLSCVDSRIPVEDVYDQNLGDVFVGRVAGNFVNTDMLGSMEFACKVAGAKLIIVMGHQHCGAIKGAIDNVQLGNLTSMLNNIKPAVEMSSNFEGAKTTSNEEYVRYVAQNNIRNTINQIRAKSEILRSMEEKGQIKIVGVFYTLRTGNLQFVN